MKEILNIPYDALPEQMLDAYLPEENTRAAFLYFHGGGLQYGSKSGYTSKTLPLGNDIALFSAEYRMYPDAKYPEFIEDAAKAVAFTLDYIKKNLNCDTLYVGGSSAGGYLSMMLCFDGKYLAKEGVTNADIAGYFHDAGQPTAHFNVLRERGLDTRRAVIDETAPLYYIEEGKHFPPMRFIISDNDLACRFEQIMLTLATLKHFGYAHFDHRVMQGKHCAYVREKDENGVSRLAPLIVDFITDAEKGII